MTVEAIKREFYMGTVRLPDPDGRMSVEEVRGVYCVLYPEIATATINGPEPIAGKLRYTFERAIGSKG